MESEVRELERLAMSRIRSKETREVSDKWNHKVKNKRGRAVSGGQEK